MQVYDKSTFDGVCDEYLGETRLESECLPGEGLNFYFRREACVPGGLYMDVSQRTYCLANFPPDYMKMKKKIVPEGDAVALSDMFGQKHTT